jgi:plastocyanin
LHRVTVLALGTALATAIGAQQHQHHHDHAMTLDRDGMVMNTNTDTLPRDCPEISRDVEIEVRVGRDYAHRGLTFGFNQHEWRVPPCSRLTVTLVNEDEVRHQWMVHGLPRYLYPQGMFHLEANGGKRKTGTFIVPSDDATYLAHCDISQHMEQGLKGQVVVGGGSGTLPSIPGISRQRYPDRY